jgi:hypothetical protein
MCYPGKASPGEPGATDDRLHDAVIAAEGLPRW